MSTPPSSTDLDALRQRFPSLGFAVYAIDPKDPVTLEVHDAGELYTFQGASLGDAIAAAFPPAPTADVFG